MSDHTCPLAESISECKSKDLYLFKHMINLFMPGLPMVCGQHHVRQTSAGLNQ